MNESKCDFLIFPVLFVYVINVTEHWIQNMNNLPWKQINISIYKEKVMTNTIQFGNSNKNLFYLRNNRLFNEIFKNTGLIFKKWLE